MNRTAIALLVAALTAACRDDSPRLDTTTDDTLERSKAVMLAELSDEGAETLQHAFRIVVMSSYGPDASEPEADAKNLKAAMEPLHGMDARAVIDHAMALPGWVTKEEWDQTIERLGQFQCFGYITG